MKTSSLPMSPAPDQQERLKTGFLLVEPATLAHVPDLAALDMCACTPRALVHREELMPRLIDVAALDEEGRRIVTERWHEEPAVERPPAICAWIDSAVGAEALAEHIARYLVGPGEGGQSVFWRYYDPRVLSLTLTIFDPTQRLALLGPARNWHFAWAGHRWRTAGLGAEAVSPDDEPAGWPRLDQWSRINRSDIVDRIRRRLPIFPADRAAQLPAALDQFLRSAGEQDAASTDELVDAAVQHMRLAFLTG
ncbi:hypothetical protein B7760_04975 [Burkholderia glumae]|uniref:DUF4123 domain-containing protein n=1 Tax=Burkholderia glumae TaxID=337 RepID=UPI0013739CCB|nr:DUF4123 domain-containing protein [Burkholderia glumae]MCR1771006.1 DUF4123 domain-containing protein [Burkholderia glumae]QHP93298.1 DUF4123 domain-containing protein [Burkholderia glumae]QKM50910.1 hypothetical protein B7760_04975 [Burkholderia glumae]